MAVLVKDSPGSLVLVKAAGKEKGKMRTLWEMINKPWEGAPGTIKHKSGIPGDGGGQMSHKELVMLAHMFDALTQGNVHHLHDEDAHPDPEHFGGGLVHPETGQKMVPKGNPGDPKSPIGQLIKMGRDAIRVMHTRHKRHISELGPNGFGPVSSYDKKTGEPRMRARDETTGEFLPKYLPGPWGPGTGPMRVIYNKPNWKKKGPGSTKTSHEFNFDEGGLVTTRTFTPKDEGTSSAAGAASGHDHLAGFRDKDETPKTESPLEDSFSTLGTEPQEGSWIGDEDSPGPNISIAGECAKCGAPKTEGHAFCGGCGAKHA